MIIKTPKYYRGFECIAGDCPDSCCQGWEVDADEASLKYYKTLDGDIRKRIDSVLSKDEFGNTIFTLADKKRCPFLNSSNLCDMHIAIGGEHTPYTCRMFPRFINSFGAVKEMGISFSCPVASDIMFSQTERFTLDSELNDEPPELNEIDGELYYFLIRAREKAYDIVYDRSISMSERLVKLLDFAQELQDNVEPYKEGDKDISFFDVFNNPELINSEWAEKVKDGKLGKISDDYYNESICAYFIFRYFMTAVFDCDILSKVKMAVIGVMIPACFGQDSWTMHLWSKETEHSQYNMDRYKLLLKDAKCLNKEELKKAITM
ncbi:MAG: flagellin lysine-N-methylase [Eubacterium sp.]|nr:flagellin lysine-N-methylase [Eubacterium sp.]